jgi:hypothetical protein
MRQSIVMAIVCAAVGAGVCSPGFSRWTSRCIPLHFDPPEGGTTSVPPEGGTPTEERVIELPEDGNQWHTILILRAGWQGLAVERRAEAMFHSEPRLVSLRHQTHWHLITTDQAEFSKFRPLVDATPCLIVERGNGEVVYRESGPELGKHSHKLTHAIRREIERHCPDGRCLPLHPVPGKDEQPPQEEIPAVLREEKTPAQSHSLVAALFTALAGLLGGVFVHWKKGG